MARINIEECWWTDPRREKLSKLVGGLDLADAAAIRAWRLAQEHWKNGRCSVPVNIFGSLEYAPALIQSGLAELRGELIYVRGSSQYLEWVAEEKEKRSLAGKISAEKRRKTHGTAQPKKPKPSNTPRTPPEHASNTLEPSVSVSGSISDSKKKELKTNSQSESSPDMGQFIGTYIQSWQKRYGKSRPDISGKVQGMMKRFLGDTPEERANELIQVFCQMNDPWFITKCHDFGTFIENIGKVNIALDTGKAPDDPNRQHHSDPLGWLNKELKNA